MTPLYQEINRWMGLPFIWGVHDCSMCAADWVWRVRGVDPVADVRGLYDDRLSAHRLTGWLRDPVAAFGGRMEAIGLQRVQVPQAGDVGLVRPPDARREVVAAVYLGDCWAVKGEHGTTTIAEPMVEVIAAWSVGYEA